jgi:hypothetical protein
LLLQHSSKAAEWVYAGPAKWCVPAGKLRLLQHSSQAAVAALNQAADQALLLV